MSLRPSTRAELRKKIYKTGVDADDARRIDLKEAYIADSESSSIRAVDLKTGGGGSRLLVGGDPFFADNLFKFGDHDGVGTEVLLQHPLGVLCTKDGQVYIADGYNHKIKKLDPGSKRVVTVTGTGKAGFKDGNAIDLCEIQIGDGISGGNCVKKDDPEPCDNRATAEGDGGGAGIEHLVSENHKAERNKKKRKERLLREAAKADNRGVCYLSRIPPHMDHVRLRHLLSQYGEIGRIYLAPEDPEAQVHRKRAGGFRGQLFSEGWVEFTKKSIAKRVADMLNGEQIGGRKRSSVFYDIWNIKYLNKFKWDDLTEEIAYKSAIREQKLNMVLSAAKRERDFYLSKVEKSRAMNAIEERMKKKEKIHVESGENAEAAPIIQPKTIRNFRQKKPVKDESYQSKPKLSSDVLAGIFSGS